MKVHSFAQFVRSLTLECHTFWIQWNSRCLDSRLSFKRIPLDTSESSKKWTKFGFPSESNAFFFSIITSFDLYFHFKLNTFHGFSFSRQIKYTISCSFRKRLPYMYISYVFLKLSPRVNNFHYIGFSFLVFPILLD